MKRLPDWQPRLLAYLRGIAAEPFAPGRHDCALFAAGAVQAMTGRDLARAYRGRYDDVLAGLRHLRRNKHDDHVALAAKHFAEIAPAMAQPGDLAVIPDPDGSELDALGVVQGPHVYVTGPAGLGIVSRLRMSRAFRVEF